MASDHMKRNIAQSIAFEDIKIGTCANRIKKITETDISVFAAITGDYNPVHLDEDYARQTRFGGRIAHGMLSAGFISAILGCEMPGPGCIYLSQKLVFKAPVRIGDDVRTEVTVIDKDESRRRLSLNTICYVDTTIVVEGEAKIWIPE